MIRAGFIFEHAHVNDNARRTEDRNALAADAWIPVGAGDHHARRLGGDKRIGYASFAALLLMWFIYIIISTLVAVKAI